MRSNLLLAAAAAVSTISIGAVQSNAATLNPVVSVSTRTDNTVSPMEQQQPQSPEVLKFNQHTDKWFSDLIEYLKPHDTNPGAPIPFIDISSAAKMVPNQRNMRDKMIPALELIDPAHRVTPALNAEQTATLRSNLLAHAKAIQDLSFKAEFRKGFSKTGDRNDVSAASEFFSMIRQACEQSKNA